MSCEATIQGHNRPVVRPTAGGLGPRPVLRRNPIEAQGNGEHHDHIRTCEQFERTQLPIQMSERRGAACYAPLGDLFYLVSLTLEKPTVNLVLGVHFPWCLPMLVAIINRERVADIALIKSLGDLVSLLDVHNLVALAVEDPYGYSGQLARAIQYELKV
jgi:hypothetical protein